MAASRKLLIAGGSYSDIPLIKAAQRLGYYVVTTGNRPVDLGHRLSDEYIACDYSDPEAMLALSCRLSIDAICACCNDFSAISAAYVAEKLQLGGHDPYQTSQLIHHKDSFRRFALDNAVPVPRARGFTDKGAALAAIDDFELPVLVKPVDLSGGKGIARVDDRAEANAVVEKAFEASKSGRIVIEQYLEGSHHGFSAILREGKVAFHFCDNEHYYLNPYMVAAASTPSVVPASVINTLIEQAEKIAGLLSLRAGILHIQFILSDNSPLIIEVCRRAPGDLYVDLVSKAAGVDYAAWIVKAAIGLEPDDVVHRGVQGYFTRHCIMSDRPGVLRSIEYSPSIKDNIVDSYVWGRPGDTVENHLVHKFGIVFMQFDTMDEMLEKTRSMPSLIRANVA